MANVHTCEISTEIFKWHPAIKYITIDQRLVNNKKFSETDFIKMLVLRYVKFGGRVFNKQSSFPLKTTVPLF